MHGRGDRVGSIRHVSGAIRTARTSRDHERSGACLEGVVNLLTFFRKLFYCRIVKPTKRTVRYVYYTTAVVELSIAFLYTAYHGLNVHRNQ